MQPLTLEEVSQCTDNVLEELGDWGRACSLWVNAMLVDGNLHEVSEHFVCSLEPTVGSKPSTLSRFTSNLTFQRAIITRRPLTHLVKQALVPLGAKRRFHTDVNPLLMQE